jgi:cytoskeletal protein RodZ
MKTFFEELRREREVRNMSLNDIADSTCINIKQLDSLERGEIASLPEPIVRAFIREYAVAVGLDPAFVLLKFDEVRGKQPGHAVPAQESPPQVSVVSAALPGDSGTLLTARNATLGGAALVVIVGAILVWNLAAPERISPAPEVPFQNVVREQEQRLPPKPVPPPDSLTLFASAVDSVWFTVSSDSLPSRQYYFRSGSKAVWRARNAFTLTLGNGAALALTLNGKPLPPMERRVIRDLLIGRQTLEKR